MPARSTKKQTAKTAKKASKALVKTRAQKKKAEPDFFTAINSLEIKQFKSIRHMKIDCKHINLFIGQPNVGKSNVLEAMALLAPIYSTDNISFFRNIIRYDDFGDIFFNMPGSEDVSIKTDINFAQIRFDGKLNRYEYFNGGTWLTSQAKIDEMLDHINHTPKEFHGPYKETFFHANISSDNKIIDSNMSLGRDLDAFFDIGLVKSYKYRDISTYHLRKETFLIPPDGPNYYSIVRNNELILDKISEILDNYKLEVVFELRKPIIRIQKRNGKFITSLTFSSLADTLRRYLFHVSAILSNDKSVLLFEEPETHSHPAYIRKLAEQIADCKNNQFFITTHSPYVLNILLERKELIDHINVFVLEYKNHETVARKLTDKEIIEFLDYGSDLFFKI
jgi:AAA15 family ATPase/GTPase